MEGVLCRQGPWFNGVIGSASYLNQLGPWFSVCLESAGTLVQVLLGPSLERFHLPFGKESDMLCAFGLFIHAGNVDSARANLFTGTRDMG